MTEAVQSRRIFAAIACFVLVSVSACIDSAGPRPRPGGPNDQPFDSAGALRYYEVLPRVISQGQTDSIRITVTVSGTPDAVRIQPRSGAAFSLTRNPSGQYSATIPVTPLMFGYRTGDLHLAAGFIEVSTGIETSETILMLNVKDATVPATNVQSVAGGQVSGHVVNLRFDSIFAGQRVPPAVLKTFYSLFGDDYTLAAVIEQVNSPRDRFVISVRNQISGIGQNLFNDAAIYGSSGALEAIIQYPIDAFFDLGETSNLHELAHRWMNYLRQPLLVSARPHWPLSDLAYGIMGWTDVQTNEALIFPFDLTPQPNGNFLLRVTDTPRTFNDLELYLMGLLPADSVRPHIVFRDQRQRADVRNNGVLRGPVDTVTMAAILGADGPRVPAAKDAPHEFRVATIVLSRGRTLSQDEMAFYEHMAARGESRLALIFSNGLIRGTTLPFFPATGGRGTLVTTLTR